ncbi:MAG TPA: Ig-like domain-containing protein [Gemmatimonadales bacterium]|nr:Ig-like domain-containing protein [Gemmatimonadales bacterium]
MKIRPLAAAGIVSLVACGELLSPRSQTASLTIVPVLDAADPYRAAASTADSLRITVVADSAGVFQDTVARATAAIDSTGSVNTTVNITLLQSPQTFRVILEALRSSDGVTVFAGEDTVVVTSESSSGTGQQVEIPIVYTGPRAQSIVIAPRDTALVSGTIAYRVTAFDSLGNVVPGVETRFFLVNPADSTRLTVDRLTGVATTLPSASGEVRVYARTADHAAYDTARVFVGAGPVGLKITPAFASLAPGDTATLSATLVDALGTPLPGGSVTWASRAASVATVGGSGLLTGVAAGTAVVVASASGMADSILVSTVKAGDAVLWALPGGRSFGGVRVGDTVTVDLTADLRRTPGETLGSYQASLDWSASVLQYADVQSGAFAAPTVNPGTGNCTHQLCLAAADPQNTAGVVTVARVRFRALATGTVSPTMTVTEMSSNVPPTFTNLFAGNRVTVTSGTVTVRP